jgi:hypothetical protein
VFLTLKSAAQGWKTTISGRFLNEMQTHSLVPQEMRHLLLQIRTCVLNDELREVFRQWYPNFPQGDEDRRWAA